MAEMPEIKVGVESVIHDAIARLLNQIERTHHIRVTGVYVDWLRMMAAPASIKGLRIETESEPRITAGDA